MRGPDRCRKANDCNCGPSQSGQVCRPKRPLLDQERELTFDYCKPADTRLEFTMTLGALGEVKRWVMGWSAEAEVIAPPELRESVRKTALAMAGAHARDAPRRA